MTSETVQMLEEMTTDSPDRPVSRAPKPGGAGSSPAGGTALNALYLLGCIHLTDHRQLDQLAVSPQESANARGAAPT